MIDSRPDAASRDRRCWAVPEGPPLAALAATFGDERAPLLFESGAGSGPFARWNLLMWDPREVLGARADDAHDEPFARIDAALARHFPGAREQAAAAREHPAADDGDRPPFTGGVAGWLSYDLGRRLERLPTTARADGDVPDLCLGVHAFALAEDRSTGRRMLVGRGSDDEARRRLDDLARAADRAGDLDLEGALAPPAGPLTTSLDRDAYQAAVGRIVEHILDGDVYQVNLAQRFELAWSGSATALHARLRRHSPAPFGALLRTPGVTVVSDSPELFLRRRGERVLSRPIKGTRPRGADAAADARLAAELEASAKEHAELAMIVDLVRNDLGRSACLGSVEVDLPFETDAWPTVFHRVVGVRARVPAATSTAALVAAAFPPASVTGTPKIRALEVIESLEPVRRHVYTGCLGWIGADGDCDLSVAIRIATALPGRLLVPVGSGITLLSDAAEEYDETLHKARALFEALRLPLPAGAGAGPTPGGPR